MPSIKYTAAQRATKKLSLSPIQLPNGSTARGTKITKLNKRKFEKESFFALENQVPGVLDCCALRLSPVHSHIFLSITK